MRSGPVRFFSAVIGGCLILAAVPAFAQQPGGGGFFGGGGKLALCAMPEVIKELECTDDQTDQIKALRDKQTEDFRALFAGGGRGNREELPEKMRALTADVDKQLGKILLPHQVKRLTQLEFQQRVSRAGTTGIGSSETLSEALKLTDSDKEALAERAKVLEQELREKMAKLRAETQAKLMEVLSPAQRAKFKELCGEPFEFPRTGGFGGGGGGGQPGGGTRPGGTRPGGGNTRPDA